MRRPLLLLTVLALAGGACSSDDAPAASSPSSAPATTTTVPLGLTEEWGCAGLVAVGNPDQTVGLFVHEDFESVDYRHPAQSGPIVGGDWVGELRRGHDLFANWCTDVVMDPQAEVESAVPVSSGTIEAPALRVDEGCGEPFTAELRDVTLEDGTDLGDFTIDTTSWGCVSG